MPQVCRDKHESYAVFLKTERVCLLELKIECFSTELSRITFFPLLPVGDEYFLFCFLSHKHRTFGVHFLNTKLVLTSTANVYALSSIYIIHAHWALCFWWQFNVFLFCKEINKALCITTKVAQQQLFDLFVWIYRLVGAFCLLWSLILTPEHVQQSNRFCKWISWADQKGDIRGSVTSKLVWIFSLFS